MTPSGWRSGGEGTGRPKVIVEANIHIAPDRFEMNHINEAIWEEDGKDTAAFGAVNGRWTTRARSNS